VASYMIDHGVRFAELTQGNDSERHYQWLHGAMVELLVRVDPAADKSPGPR
jgi:hypothetical protein